MASALITLAEGFEDIEAVTVIDVFRRGGVETTIASVSGSLEVTSAHGIKFVAECLFPDVSDRDFDAIVLPGGMPGTANLRACAPLIDRIGRQMQEGKFVCAICAAPTILSGEGLVPPEVHMTCYPTCSGELDRPCANVPVVADENVITGQAPGSALLFSLVVLERLVGEEIAGKVAHGMVTDVY